MQDNTADTFTGMFVTIVGLYVVSGITIVYGYNNKKFGVTDTTLRYFIITGFGLAVLIIIGLAIMQMFDSAMSGLI